MLIGQATANAKKKTGLPFPTAPTAAPSVTSPTLPTPSLPPTNVADALKNTNSTVNEAKGALTANQPFLDNYLKPTATGVTPFRQSLTNTKASDTANAYDNAVARVREKSAAAGFSSNSQPVTFGAEAGLANERAKAIADIPNKVNIEAQPAEFQAAGMQQSQAGILNALAGTQQGSAGILNQEELQKNAQKGALASGLAQAGLNVGVPLIKSALAKRAPGVVDKVAPTVASKVGPALASAAVPGSLAVGGGAALGTAAAAPSLSAIAGGVVPELPATLPGILGTAPAAVAPGAGGGLGATLGTLAANPVTWAVAGAITAAIIWKKSQVHQTASTFVSGYQDPFGKHLGTVVDSFDQAAASGKLDKTSATAARNETAKLIEEFKRDTNEFAQKGSHENQAAHQAAATMAQYFGANWENILGKMDATIAGLA